jgi:hypothetical protein
MMPRDAAAAHSVIEDPITNGPDYGFLPMSYATSDGPLERTVVGQRPRQSRSPSVDRRLPEIPTGGSARSHISAAAQPIAVVLGDGRHCVEALHPAGQSDEVQIAPGGDDLRVRKKAMPRRVTFLPGSDSVAP